MNQIATGSNPLADDKQPVILTPEMLARVQSLYDKGLCRQAFELGSAVSGIHLWRGTDACILAGRIALNLGATQLAFRQHIRAFQATPTRVRAQAYYLEVFLAMRGPVFAWEKFRQFERDIKPSSEQDQADEGCEYLFTVGARICGHLRDFERAEEYLKMAEKNRSNSPWLLVEQATLLGLKE